MALVTPKLKEINLKTNSIVLDDGTQYPLSPEARAFYENPEAAKLSKGIEAEERSFKQASEKIPFGGNLYAVSKGLAESNFGMLKNLINKYALQPGAAQFADESLSTADATRAQRLGSRRVGREAEKEYPLSYKMGQAIAIASDLGLSLPKLLQKSPTATGAAFGFSSAPPAYEDPEGALKGAAIGGAVGYGAGKVTKGLEKVAGERQALRQFAKEEAQYPKDVQKAKEAFRKTQMDKLNRASNDLRHGASRDSLKNQNFINQNLKVSEIAGSREAAEVEKFINIIESGLPEKLSSKEIVKLFDALEGKIAQASPEAAPLYSAYKDHLVQVLPEGAAFQAVKQNIGNQIIDRSRFGNGKAAGLIDKRVNNAIKDLTPEEFYTSLNNGELTNIIRNEIKEGYKEFYKDRFSGKAGQKSKYLRDVEERAQNYVDKLDWLEKDVASLRAEANDIAQDYFKRVSSRVRNATGTQNPNYPDILPTNRLEMPTEPVKPAVGGMAERFEQPFNPFDQLKESFGNTAKYAAMGKFLGIPGSLAKGVLGAGVGAAKVATEGVGRFLTAPTTVSQITRESITKGGIPLIVQSIASTYPSYDKGILLDPLDRQDAVAELENNPYIPLEQKAVLQAKINRGRTIEDLTEIQEEVK